MIKRRAVNRPITNQRPITIGGFTLTATGMEVRGRPSKVEYEAVGEFINRTVEACGFWRVDWITYGDGREDWKKEIDSMIDAGVMTDQAARQARYLGKNVPISRRVTGVGFAQHCEVAGCDAQDQVPWLEKAQAHGWTARELRMEIRASKRRKVLEGQAVLKGMYRVVLADPPWIYGDRPPSGYGAQTHYSGMTIDAMCRLPVAAHTMPDAVLFLWTTAPILLENPGPREVIEAWGFTPKTGFVWDKVRHGFGHYVEVRHEHLIICTRGSCLPDRPTPMFPSVLTERRSDEHSAKPATVRTMIERLYDGPRVELFARGVVDGWDAFGDDAQLWASEAEAQS